MKRSTIAKKSKLSISKIQRQIWDECRRVLKKTKCKPDGSISCYTCDSPNLEGSNCQLGHVPYPKSVLGAYLKYDFRVLEWQCISCNIHRGGMGATAYQKMLKEKGKKFMEQLEKDRQVTVKAIDHYITILEEYKNL